MSFSFLEYSGQKMLAAHHNFQSLYHSGVKGELHENALSQVLQQYLPKKYGVTTGIVVDAKGTQSKQQDIIIYDIESCPFFLNEGEQKVIPVESVYGTIEVKTSLDSTVLSGACKNIENVKSLYSTNKVGGVNSIPLGFVFAYSTETKIETLCQRLISINEMIPMEKRINGICILNKGLIVYFRKDGFDKMSCRPREGFFECSMAGDEKTNYINFYVTLLSGLKHQQVSFPDIQEYAINAGYLKQGRIIGEQEMPEDAYIYSQDGNNSEKIFLHTLDEYKKR